MSAALDAAWAVCRRTWTKTLRRPVHLTFSLGQPLIWMLFFGFLFERYLEALPGGRSYLDFLAPGVCAMTVLFGASQAGVGWIRDLQTGFLPRLLNTPVGAGPLLAGKVAADVLRLLAQAAAVLLLALALGARFTAAPVPAAAGLAGLALFAAAFSCLSSIIALTARSPEALATFVHLVNMPLLFTSTALVPRREMPDWLAALARVNPLSLAVDGWRGALLDAAMPAPAALVALALLAVVLYAAAAAALSRLARWY